MSDRFVTKELSSLLAERKLRAFVGWNRLEGRPRTLEIASALRAEVRDALWMLTRQWQMGEFKGDDAGSPISAAPLIEHSQLTRFQAGGGTPEDFDADVPPEARVEARPLVFQRSKLKASLDIRVQMGRHWLRMIGGIGDFAKEYRREYKIELPDPEQRSQAGICAHAEVWQSFAAAAGRLMDGHALYAHLTEDPSHAASDRVAAPPSAKADLDKMGKRFVEWFHRQYHEPESEAADSWFPERLEYQFKASAPGAAGEKVFTADEYFHGRLDWYNVDIDSSAAPLGAVGAPGLTAAALVPVPITFPGMPDTRWWAFEDGKTNLGKSEASTTDLGRMLFLEFALLYANDWYMMPLTLPSGAVAAVKGIAVTNVFGERFWVAPAGEGIDDDWRRWTMFTTSKKGQQREVADTALHVAPVVPKIQEGKPLDEILFTRDEMANMVWAIEHTLPLLNGGTKPGLEAARELRAYYEQHAPRSGAGNPALPPVAKLRYDLMSSVPEHWIPFVPARKPLSNREILLQRGAMLRLIEDDLDKPRRIVPLTATLREGLDQPKPQGYFLNEEEVPRAGARVTRSFQRTRWRFGRTCVWLGMRKQAGRGEGVSNLAFDSLLPVKE